MPRGHWTGTLITEGGGSLVTAHRSKGSWAASLRVDWLETQAPPQLHPYHPGERLSLRLALCSGSQKATHILQTRKFLTIWRRQNVILDETVSLGRSGSCCVCPERARWLLSCAPSAGAETVTQPRSHCLPTGSWKPSAPRPVNSKPTWEEHGQQSEGPGSGVCSVTSTVRPTTPYFLLDNFFHPIKTDGRHSPQNQGLINNSP